MTAPSSSPDCDTTSVLGEDPATCASGRMVRLGAYHRRKRRTFAVVTRMPSRELNGVQTAPTAPRRLARLSNPRTAALDDDE